MKSFKELRVELSEAGLEDTMARKFGGIPLSAVASQKKAVEREAELNKAALAPPKKPFVVGSTTIKTDGGLYNPGTVPILSPTKLATSSGSSSGSVKGIEAPVKISMSPPATTSSDAARTPVNAPATRQSARNERSPSSGIKRLSTAVGKPSKNIPVVDTAIKPISKGSKSSAPVPVIKKVSPQELVKPKIAAKVDKSIDVAQQTGVTARMGQSGRTQTFSNIARGASSAKSSSGMFQKAGTEYSAQKNLPPHGSAARDVELAKRGYKKF